MTSSLYRDISCHRGRVHVFDIFQQYQTLKDGVSVTCPREVHKFPLNGWSLIEWPYDMRGEVFPMSFIPHTVHDLDIEDCKWVLESQEPPGESRPFLLEQKKHESISVDLRHVAVGWCCVHAEASSVASCRNQTIPSRSDVGPPESNAPAATSVRFQPSHLRAGNLLN